MRGIASLLLVPALAGLPASNAAPAQQSVVAPPDEARALSERAITNQHHNDDVVNQYERIERHYARQGSRVVEDKIYRVVPTGTGTLKLLIKQNGRAVDPAYYRKQLRDWEQVLQVAVNPDDPRERESEEKARKKARERAELVDAVRQAFRFTEVGREEHDGRAWAKIAIEPNPAYRPRSSSVELLTHVRATLWIDEAAAQMARAEANIIRDISFGGGILGKVYRGGHFEMEQDEVAPGVWLPTRYQYDFEGRKFFFGFSVHETTEVSRYRYVGSPKDALALVRGELATGQGLPADP